jgi:hypothetical protein
MCDRYVLGISVKTALFNIRAGQLRTAMNGKNEVLLEPMHHFDASSGA